MEENIIWITDLKTLVNDRITNNTKVYYKSLYLGKGAYSKVYSIDEVKCEDNVLKVCASHACKIISKNKVKSMYYSQLMSRFKNNTIRDFSLNLFGFKRLSSTALFAKQKNIDDAFYQKIYKEILIHQDACGLIANSDEIAECRPGLMKRWPLCENILKFVRSFEDSEYIYIITELCDDNLQNIIDNEISFSIRNYFYQLIKGVNYLHNINIIHGDLKPLNLLIKNNVLKIADFGFAIYGDSDIINSCGTPNFIAPEIVTSTVKRVYIEKVDIWACGVILYNMMFLRLPFEKNIQEDLSVIYKRIAKCEYELPYHSDLILLKILKNILQLDPVDRFTTRELLNIFSAGGF